MAICAYLLHSHISDTADDAMSYFLEKMYPGEENPKSIFSPSMKRYLKYYQV